MATLHELAARLRDGLSSRQLVDECLARIEDPAGEGARTFLKVHAGQARAAADACDKDRRAGHALSAFAGIPISIKDLFDIAGDVTTAGSLALRDAPPATADAAAVARLKAAGFIVIGRTNMTEFAFSGLGLNPHYGTPLNPYDRANRRIPGGSSSGAAVSITDGMAFGALGTDTGGSCRIPAAFCGIVGFKPTARRVPLDGAFPLSASLDSIGPLAASVACCAVLDAVLAGEQIPATTPSAPVASRLRFAVPKAYVFDGIEAPVARAFERAVSALSAAGATIDELPLAELNEMPAMNAKGGFPAPEAYVHHRDLIARKSALYDPRVLVRILRGREQSPADYEALKAARRNFIVRVDRVTAPYDAMLMPTTPIVAPLQSALDDDADFGRINLLALRNPTVANFLDRCAISIPCHRAGEAPVGLTLVGANGADRTLLATAMTVEQLVAPPRPH